MPSTRPPARAPSSTPMGRIELMLEEIRAQNAATIDAVHATGRELRDEIVRLEARVSTLEAVLRHNSAEIAALKAAFERLEGKLDNKADRAKLEALERRVAALESART